VDCLNPEAVTQLDLRLGPFRSVFLVERGLDG